MTAITRPIRTNPGHARDRQRPRREAVWPAHRGDTRGSPVLYGAGPP